ncbi:hypothetical protein LXL04_035728 [Taraxacum kok-saghyz]
MAPAVAEDLSLPHISDNDLEPFFVLHKASPRQHHAKKPVGKTRRSVKVDLSTSLNNSNNHEAEGPNDESHENLRMKNFHNSWLTIESTIKDCMHNINADVFNEIDTWVHKSFDTICTSGRPDANKATCSYPIVTDVTAKQLFTALVVMNNSEFVDDLQTFADLGVHLNSHGCHVANLSSVDFSVKNGVGGCLRSLSRQILKSNIDAADISILASWYMEQENSNHPVVVIIEDMDRCSGPVLSDFILMLSEWVIKIPVMLIMGVATMPDFSKSLLSSKAVQHLSLFKFFLGSPAGRLDSIIESVLVKPCSGFLIGHKVAGFIRSCFLRQDGTLTSLVRAVKMALLQHYLMEPQSFTMIGLGGPSKMKEVMDLWSCAVLCLHEAGKNQKTTLLDLYHESLNPKLKNMKDFDYLESKSEPQKSSWNYNMNGQSVNIHKGGLIGHTIRQIRDLPPAALFQLLKKWSKLTDGVSEIHEKVRELQSQEKSENNSKLKETGSRSRRQVIRNVGNLDGCTNALNEKAAAFMSSMARDHLQQPIESIPFHETVCFTNVDKLHAGLLGDPRKRIQLDLLGSHTFIKCSCCTKSGSSPISTMHDTALMYMLAQEYGDVINLHDWYQSFRGIIFQKSDNRSKSKSKVSPSPKKRKTAIQPQNNITEASVQARFCRAVTELQITGLLRMPTKRRPDFVQRVAFGL